MSDPHVTINLTFRTPVAPSVVLESVLSAFNEYGRPYDLTAASCSTFDLDEVDDS